MTGPQKYELSDEARAQIVAGTIRKIRNAGDINSPEARMVYAIFEQAVRDATWEPTPRDLKLADSSKVARRRIREGEDCRREARQWFGLPICAHYLGLVGIDHDYAVDKIVKLLRLVDA